MRKEFHAWKIDGKVFISYEAVAEVGRRAAAAGAHGACCAKIIELPNNAKQQEARIEAHAAIPYVRTRYVRHISSFPPYLCIFPPYLLLLFSRLIFSCLSADTQRSKKIFFSTTTTTQDLRSSKQDDGAHRHDDDDVAWCMIYYGDGHLVEIFHPPLHT